MPPNIHILFVLISYYSKFFLILIGKPPPYQKQNCQHTERRIVFKERSFEFKIMEFRIKIAMGFKNKESLENLRHTKKFVFYLLKLKNATKPF